MARFSETVDIKRPPEEVWRVLGQPEATGFLAGYEELIRSLTDGFVREGKRFLTLAIGCTGGRHRSVVMAEALAERLRGQDVSVLVVHRDLGRE